MSRQIFDGEELWVGRGEVLGRQGGVGGPQQPRAVEVGLGRDRGVVDPQQSRLRTWTPVPRT